MKNRLGQGLLFLAAVGLFAAPVSAGWMAFDKDATAQGAIMKVEGSLEAFTVDVTIPGIEILDSKDYVTVRIPGQPRIMRAGEPEIPYVTTSILLPDRGMPRITLSDVEETVIDLKKKIMPSRGHLTRDVDPSTVPLKEGDLYTKNAFVPADEFKVERGNPYILRDFRGATLRLGAVVYNPVSGKLRVARKFRVKVEMGKDGVSVNDKTRMKGDGFTSEFAPVYASLFLNWKLGKALPNEQTGRAIVLCPDKWLPSMEPLQAWRAQKGLQSKVIPMSAVGNTATAVTSCIQNEYNAGGLAFILLVGDADSIPTLKGVNENADSDACFTKLEGDDHHADAFISRFSAKTTAEVDVQVARVLKYEKEPATGEAAGFYKKAMGIASAEGSPTDKERAGWLRDAELAYHYTSVDEIYDPGASKAKVAEGVNEGRGLINYIGHGSKNMWVTSRFSNTDVKALNNGDGKWPVIWSVACVNGDFVRGDDCFCEAWAKVGTAENPKGSIGIVGASTNMSWVPPCDWQLAINKDYMIAEKVFTGGALHCWGIEKAMETNGDDENSEGLKLLEQCVYFGDNSVVIRTDIPRVADVNLVVNQPAPPREGEEPPPPPPATVKMAVTVQTAEGPKPVARAWVAVRGALQSAGVTAVTGDDGTVEFPLQSLQELAKGSVRVTVTGRDLVPVLDKELALPEPPAPPAEPPVEPPAK